MPSHHFFLNQHTQYTGFIFIVFVIPNNMILFFTVNVVMIQLFVASFFFGY